MGKKLGIKRKCCICQKQKDMKKFKTKNESQKFSAACITCQPIFKGIKEKLLTKEVYIGLNFNTQELKGDGSGFIIQLNEDKTYQKISLEEAKRIVRQGGAFVLSTNTIEMLTFRQTGGKEIREYVLQRDKGKCYYCSEKGDTVDHVIPKWQGGLDTPLNMVCACWGCNQLKGHRDVEDFVTNKEEIKEKKHEVQELILEKKCQICEEQKGIYEFEKRKNVCLHCKKYQKAFALKLISKEEIKRLNSNVKSINGEWVELLNKEGKRLKEISKGKAKCYIMNGVARILSENKIQLIFTKNQLFKLYPSIEFKSLEDGEVLPAEFSEDPIIKVKLKKEKVELYDYKNEFVSLVPNWLAREIVERKFGIIEEDNKVKMTAPTNKLDQGIEAQIEKAKKKIYEDDPRVVGPNVSVFNPSGEYVEAIDLDGAKKLLKIQMAKVMKQNRIQLLTTVKELKENYHNEIPRQIFLCKEKTVSRMESKMKKLTKESYPIYSKDELFIALIPKKLVVELFKKQLIEFQDEKRIVLTKTVSEAMSKEPSLIMYCQSCVG